MSADILLRIGLALGIIVLGLLAYWLVNRRLLARVPKYELSLFGVAANKAAIVYFTTPYCAPCKTVQRPALDQLSELMGDKLQVIEIDAIEQPEFAKRWGVFSVPTTFLLNSRGEARYVNNGVARVEKLIEQFQTL